MSGTKDAMQGAVTICTLTGFLGGVYGFFSGWGHYEEWYRNRQPKGDSHTIIGPIVYTTYEFSSFLRIVGSTTLSTAFVGATFPVSVPLMALMWR